jgi:hypothetical protein
MQIVLRPTALSPPLSPPFVSSYSMAQTTLISASPHAYQLSTSILPPPHLMSAFPDYPNLSHWIKQILITEFSLSARQIMQKIKQVHPEASNLTQTPINQVSKHFVFSFFPLCVLFFCF